MDGEIDLSNGINLFSVVWATTTLSLWRGTREAPWIADLRTVLTAKEVGDLLSDEQLQSLAV